MKKNLTKLLLILCIAVALKSIFWVFLIPLWHTPDEQAHFGHVAYIAEGGDLLLHGKKKNMTEEIYTSLEILGTKRDDQGNNFFTFHPEYRLPYSQTLMGPQEEVINSFSAESRKTFAIKESAYYPHLYYQVSSLIYQLCSSANLFIRVFTIRLFWLLAYWLLIYLSFKSAQLIFSKNRLLVITVTILTGFQPMLSFVASGVTSDNLYNLLFTAVIYLCLKIINSPKALDFLLLTLTLGIGLITKQQFIISFALVVPTLTIALIKNFKAIFKYLLFLPLALVLAYLLAPAKLSHLLSVVFTGQLPYLSLNPDQLVKPDYSFFNHLRWTLIHTVKEVLPWYWGVFNWLGVVLPRSVNRILMRLLVLAGLGLIIKLFNIVKKHQFNQQTLLLAFIAWTAFIYFFALTFWDWTFTRRNGFSFGIQGRYYFPVILAHMILLAVGIQSVFQLLSRKLANWSLKILSVGFVVLNFIGLYTVAGSYYDLSSFKTFIIQASQYKPWFAKGMFLSLTLILFFISQLILIYKLIVYDQKNS